ncbi:MAG: hypothetical protein CMB75_01300 [Euryarchaeota archaeon]|nr:hypothetical protein [Euryarchaeota archaeon]|tara:strand:- start:3955 stop:4512 length:558 start_codon:yes stop_codon:yes gene_type:complete
MKVSRNAVRNIVFVFGPMVLASYVVGVWRMDDPMELWGGIPESWISLNVMCMFIAAAGFLITWWKLLFGWDAAVVEAIGWPWDGEVSEGGHRRILIAFLLILIPSMLWLELTRMHIQHDSLLTQWIVIANLWLVVFGNILLILFGWSAWSGGADGTDILPLLGSLMLGIQIIVNDGILWVWLYPW